MYDSTCDRFCDPGLLDVAFQPIGALIVIGALIWLAVSNGRDLWNWWRKR